MLYLAQYDRLLGVISTREEMRVTCYSRPIVVQKVGRCTHGARLMTLDDLIHLFLMHINSG